MKRLRTVAADFGLVAAAMAVSALLVMAGLQLAGYPAGSVAAEWIVGALGSRFDIMVAIKNSCPLILTGLAAGVAFRSGVFNIGGEGQAVLGAVAVVVVGTRLMPHAGLWVGIPLALAAAAIFGALWAGLAALLERYRGVPLVLSTILLNFIALQLLGILLEGPLKAAGTGVVQSDPLGAGFWLPELSRQYSLHAGILLAVFVAGASWLVQARTAFGFELHVVGINPAAARLAGMAVGSRQMAVMLISGGFAGLGGAVQVMGVAHFLGDQPSGYGYAGIAVALLGRLHPAGIVLAALFFGLLDQGASNVEISQYELPHEVADIVKGLMVLMILVGTAYLGRRRTMARER